MSNCQQWGTNYRHLLGGSFYMEYFISRSQESLVSEM